MTRDAKRSEMSTRPDKARRRKRVRLVDTSSLPPVPYRTVAEMVASRPPGPPRAFTDAEIKAALEEDRADRWRRKSSERRTDT